MRLTERQAEFLGRRLNGKKLVLDSECARAEKLASLGFVTLTPGPSRAPDRTKRTRWQYAELTELGRKAWKNSYLQAVEGNRCDGITR